jgi:hypothetical protein
MAFRLRVKRATNDLTAVIDIERGVKHDPRLFWEKP